MADDATLASQPASEASVRSSGQTEGGATAASVSFATTKAKDPNEELIGHPLMEVDPLFFGKTFCVISKKQKTNYIHRFSSSKSLFLFGPLSPVRKFAIRLTTHRWFDFIIIMTILLNCVTLALISNKFVPGTEDEEEDAQFEEFIEKIEYGFLVIYTMELILKVIAKGFLFNKFAYLRNRWNILDMIVITSGYITIVEEIIKTNHEEKSEVEFLRTLRVIRVLKTVSVLPGLKMMINTVLSSIKRLVEVMILILFCLMIFSLFAVQMFQGILRQRCVIDKGGPMDPGRMVNKPIETIADPEERDKEWTLWVSDWKNWKRREFPEEEPTQCGNDSDTRLCETGYTCLPLVGKNPDEGWTSFDNFYLSMLSCFQLLTADYWERVYDLVVSSFGTSSAFFFITIIFMGSYYLLNLLLAVMTISYESEAKQLDHSKMAAPERLRVNRRASNFSFDDLSTLNICKFTPDGQQPRKSIQSQSQASKAVASKSLIKEQKKVSLPLGLDDAILNVLGIRTLNSPENEDQRRLSVYGLNVQNLYGNRASMGPLGLAGLNAEIKEQELKEVQPGPSAGASPSQAEAELAPVTDSKRSSFVDEETRIPKEEADHSDDASLISKIMAASPSESEIVVKDSGSFSFFKLDFIRPFVTHWCFENVITVCIILNTVVLAMEYQGQRPEYEEWLKLCNHIFLGVFTLECILKLIALQKEYFTSAWNNFDMAVLGVSYCDLLLVQLSVSSSGISVLRSMRLLRVFKLAQSWITMKVLLNIIFSSFADLGNLVLLLMIIIYIFAVMGMRVVGEEYSPGAFDAVHNSLRFPRWNWKHFWYAFMMVFRVLCGEWIEPLRDCLMAQEFQIQHRGAHPLRSYFKCFAVFLPILIVGNFIVFNLFLAMLLNSFDTDELNKQLESEKLASGRDNMRNIVTIMMMQKDKEDDDDWDDDDDVDEEEEVDEHPKHPESTDHHHHSNVTTSQSSAPAPKPSRKSLYQRAPVAGKSLVNVAKRRWKWAIKKTIILYRHQVADWAIARAENKFKRQYQQILSRLFLKNPGATGTAGGIPHDETPEQSDSGGEVSNIGADCFPKKWCKAKICCRCWKKCLPKWNSFIKATFYSNLRDWSIKIVGHPAFEYFILILIFASSVTLCFEDIHLQDRHELKRILCIINIVLTVIFFVEMILKLFAIGIWGYCTNFWTILDGFIVVISLVSIYFEITLERCLDTEVAAVKPGHEHDRDREYSNLGALKALRTLRALRPLRAISRWQGMKIVVNSLIQAIPAIFNVLLVCLLLWLIFSIMGVQFFKGKFSRCVNNEGELVDHRAAPNKEVCCKKLNSHGYSWVNTISNYDNVLEGYLSLFQVATFEGWMEIMSYSVDAVGYDRQPIMDYQIGYYAFYVVFLIVGSFFALQLIIGVIIDNVNMLKKKYEGGLLEILLTPDQRNYYIAMKNLGRKKPRPMIRKPKIKLLVYFYHVALSRRLEIFVMIMIFLNMAVEACETADISEYDFHILTASKAFFASVYFLEALIKILGLGWFYFSVPWNVYDMIVVFATLLDCFITKDLSAVMPISPSMLRIVRVFRIGRILRSVKAARGLRKLLYALTVSLPALFNIGALLGLITFIYAILGMALFGKAPRKWSIDEVFNFDTFLHSSLLLFRLMTAAGWNEILDSLTVVRPICGYYRHIECGLKGEPDCPNRGVAVAYIVSYLLLTNQIMIQLFFAIILENFIEASNEEDVGIVDDDLEMYYLRWSNFDPYATQFIHFNDLPDFLDGLNPPFRVKKPNTIAIVFFNLPITRGNKIHCLDILHALIKHVLGQIEDSPDFRRLQSKMERKFDVQFPSRRLLEIVSTTRRWKLEQNAAKTIQRYWRKYMEKVHPQNDSRDIKNEVPSDIKVVNNEGQDSRASLKSDLPSDIKEENKVANQK